MLVISYISPWLAQEQEQISQAPNAKMLPSFTGKLRTSHAAEFLPESLFTPIGSPPTVEMAP